jgi:ABC-2 type transport system ATP-binding protein
VLCDRIALMHLGTVRAEGSPEELKRALGPDATLEDVFRHHTGGSLAADTTQGGLRAIRSTRRTARRVG